MFDPKKVYGQQAISTISAEEAMIKLHEKILERIERIKELNEDIRNLSAKEIAKNVDKFNKLLNERGKQVDLVINSIDAIKGLISDDVNIYLKEQIWETYNSIKIAFLKAVLDREEKYFTDVEDSIKILLEGWRENFRIQSEK